MPVTKTYPGASRCLLGRSSKLFVKASTIESGATEPASLTLNGLCRASALRPREQGATSPSCAKHAMCDYGLTMGLTHDNHGARRASILPLLLGAPESSCLALPFRLVLTG